MEPAELLARHGELEGVAGRGERERLHVAPADELLLAHRGAPPEAADEAAEANVHVHEVEVAGRHVQEVEVVTRTTFAPEVSTICRSRSAWPTQNDGSDGSLRPGTRRSSGTRSRTAARSTDSTSRQRAVSRKDSTRPRRTRRAVAAGKVSVRVTARSSRRPTTLPSGSRTGRPWSAE